MFNERFADVRFAVTGVGRGIGHDQPGPAFWLERRGKKVDPEVIGIGDGDRAFVFGFGLVSGNAECVKTPVGFHFGKVDVIHIERRIGKHVIEFSEACVSVLVIGVGLLDIAAQTIDGNVHFGKFDSFERFFLPVNKEARILAGRFTRFDKLCGLHEHAARAAGGIKDSAVVRFDYLHHQADHRTRRKKFSAFLAFRLGKFAEKVFVNLAEHVA